MKKFTKILVVALTVCLIVGVMAVSASAVTTPADATGTITNKTYDMDIDNSGALHTSSWKCTVMGHNHLQNGTHDGSSHGDRAVCPNAGGLLFRITDGFLKTFKYLAFGFDFCADKYLDESGALTDENTGKIAYAPQLKIGSYNNLRGSYADVYAYFVTDGTNWYLSGDDNYSSEDVALSNVAGVNNRLTLIDDGSETYVFVNGEYVCTANITIKGATDFRPGVSIGNEDREMAKAHNFSIAFSNIGVNAYSADYESGSAFGIDKYIALEDYRINLYNCVDVDRDEDYIEANLATFTYEGTGSTLRTGLYNVNKALTLSEEIDLGNGWYNVKINSWKEKDSKEIVAGGTYTLVPADDLEVVDAVKYKANLTFLDEYKFNIYVKKLDESVVKGVTFSGADATSTVTINNEEYYCITSPVKGYFAGGTPASFETEITFTPVYDGVESGSMTYKAKVTLDQYLIQANEAYDHVKYPTEARLLATFLAFGDQCIQHGGATQQDWVKSVLNTYHKDCDCLSSALPQDVTSAENELSGCMVGYYHEPLGNYNNSNFVKRIGLAIYVPQNADGTEPPAAETAAKMSATLRGIAVAEDGKTKTNQEITVGFYRYAPFTVSGKQYYIYLSNPGDLAIYNMLEEVTITIDGKTGTTSLAEYVANNDIAYTNALYRFAEAAKAFKMEGATKAN